MPAPKDLRAYPKEFFDLLEGTAAQPKGASPISISFETQSARAAFRARWNAFIKLIRIDARHPLSSHAWRVTTRSPKESNELEILYGTVGGNFVPVGLEQVLAKLKESADRKNYLGEPIVAQTEKAESLTDVITELYKPDLEKPI